MLIALFIVPTVNPKKHEIKKQIRRLVTNQLTHVDLRGRMSHESTSILDVNVQPDSIIVRKQL